MMRGLMPWTGIESLQREMAALKKIDPEVK